MCTSGIPLSLTFLDGYCSTVQGLLDWFEVDLGFTELLFIQIDVQEWHASESHLTLAPLSLAHMPVNESCPI